MSIHDKKYTSNVADWYDQYGEPTSTDYPQLGNTYRSLNDEAKKQLTGNIITAIKSITGTNKQMAVNLELCHWFRMDMGLGMAVANGLNIDIREVMKHMPA